MSKIHQYFKILCGLVQNSFFAGGRSEYIEFGAGNFVCEFSTMMKITRVLSDKYVGLLTK